MTRTVASTADRRWRIFVKEKDAWDGPGHSTYIEDGSEESREETRSEGRHVAHLLTGVVMGTYPGQTQSRRGRNMQML